MKKKLIISTGASPKTLRLNFEKVIIGENPKNKSGNAYAFVPNEAQFAIELYRLVHSFAELPGSIIVFAQNLSGKKYPVAVITSDSDLRATILEHRVAKASWCCEKLHECQSQFIVFQPAKVG